MRNHVLSDGTEVTLRALRSDDVDALRRMFFRLSPTTVYLRFFQQIPPPSERRLRYLATVDHDQREAIAAVAGDEIVGVARYDRLRNDPHRAEAAIVVEDAWQGHGLGHVLLLALADNAVEHGVTAFSATVLGENHRMLALAHHVAPQTKTHLDHGEWLVDIPLGV